MSEERASRDNGLQDHTDSNRQIVSRDLGTFSDDSVQIVANNSINDNVNTTCNPLKNLIHLPV